MRAGRRGFAAPQHFDRRLRCADDARFGQLGQGIPQSFGIRILVAVGRAREPERIFDALLRLVGTNHPRASRRVVLVVLRMPRAGAAPHLRDARSPGTPGRRIVHPAIPRRAAGAPGLQKLTPIEDRRDGTIVALGAVARRHAVRPPGALFRRGIDGQIQHSTQWMCAEKAEHVAFERIDARRRVRHAPLHGGNGARAGERRQEARRVHRHPPIDDRGIGDPEEIASLRRPQTGERVP